ncbi:MAG: diheme cytochrome c [Burkholderiales bacterium]|nr:diheme cytochrome c [Burkholderiales bacterium]
MTSSYRVGYPIITSPYRMLAIAALAVTFTAVLLERAWAGGHFYPPVTDPLVREECGSCHLAFSPSMLPAASWQRMMRGLSNHFGDDASVDAQIASRITRILVDNAADAGGRPYGEKLLRGVTGASAPLRITELPKWVREHRKVPQWEWTHKDVRTKANCLACHAGAERGYYGD